MSDKANLISFVIIGYNESATLGACIRSAKESVLPEGFDREVIYVDGGSSDDSIALCRDLGLDKLLGGEKRRRASENRNLGIEAARGAYIQFVDGDMELDPQWVGAALALLQDRADLMAVYGVLNEAGTTLFDRVLEADWKHEAGEVPYTGGAALWRSAPLKTVGGFPTDVRYGEEPYLCWRIRNSLDLRVYHLPVPMARHHIGHRSFLDYWRRTVRVGETYPEIAVRCLRHREKLWLGECIHSIGWGFAWLFGVLALLLGGTLIQSAVLLGLVILLARKTLQSRRKGKTWLVAFLYSVHTYFVKLPLAYGGFRWLAGAFWSGKLLTYLHADDEVRKPL